jgi:hypothetical protein
MKHIMIILQFDHKNWSLIRIRNKKLSCKEVVSCDTMEPPKTNACPQNRYRIVPFHCIQRWFFSSWQFCSKLPIRHENQSCLLI